MGESGIDATVKKYKKRMKKTCYCGIIWSILAVLALVVGIALLVNFAKYWGDETTLKRGLAYTGLACVLLFLLSLAIAVILFVIMRVIYLRLEGGGNKKMFTPPTFGPGLAPYPQQPPEPTQNLAPPSESSPLRDPPSAPPGQGLGEIKIEVSDNSRF